MTLPSDFKEFLRLLSEKNVKYLIVGGYAVVYHGYPRSTGDMDVWVDSTEENADRESSREGVEVLVSVGFLGGQPLSDCFPGPFAFKLRRYTVCFCNQELVATFASNDLAA